MILRWTSQIVAYSSIANRAFRRMALRLLRLASLLENRPSAARAADVNCTAHGLIDCESSRLPMPAVWLPSIGVTWTL